MTRAIPAGCLAALLLGAAASAQTIEGLQVPPADSAEAERLRIWAAAEGTSRCRMIVEVVDSANRVVRRLVDFLAAPGYYNFYWDKRDDSGLRVPEGKYRGRVDYCGALSWENLTARYSLWELQSDLTPFDPDNPFRIGVVLTADGAPVAAEILNRRDVHFDVMLPDTVLDIGTHWIPYRPPERMPRGNYTIRIKVGDYEYRREVTYLP
ncbi:MAG TPA: FlgD immunoglobulin-like domain containing protein [candidate division Zixibacteria bacterium]|nr:hypothetical protein [candidate division Zixibacteria bacterium]MDD4916804.1 FlgD immunoglobulin-like domain containing protein [candidate division Zixibacteria bacterium]MDM7973133.1 FlgD immunoglobulin-like domain containing protein [candidate division Zixibacteria bacterium]HOD65194.1 FlgD immunoglobulin-like domain containing protein [candidate division Zixibacteria bacterium]HPI31761.1 FlgD immunoglobulin-like domain containing protein [candidate division Zixibacteria bacterium]